MRELFNKYIKNKYYLIFVFLLFPLSIIQRHNFISISQWREDQATTYWLAFINNLFDIKVGLISSKLLANPNGLLLYSKPFTFIENFKISILLYSLSQLLMILFFFKHLKINDKKLKYILFFTVIFNFYVSTASVEIWAQFFYISFNFYLLGTLYYFYNNKKIDAIDLILILVIIPSFYLGGILNLFAYLFVLLYLIIFKKLKIYINKKINLMYFLKIISLIFILNKIWLEFLLYLNDEDLFNFLNAEKNYPTLKSYIKFLLFFDLNNIFTLFSETNIQSELTKNIFLLFNKLGSYINLYFNFLLFLYLYNLKKYKQRISTYFLLIFLFIYVSYLISPFLGGENLIDGSRKDVSLQFFCLYIVMFVLLHFELFKFYKKRDTLNIILKYSLTIFIVINLVLSFSVYFDYINYEGEELSSSDVPLNYKIEIVDFISSLNFTNQDSRSLKIYYDLAGTEMGWLEEFGYNYPDYYNFPYTFGRIFDLLLLKKYNISNEYEGSMIRLPKNPDIVITYRYHSKIDTNIIIDFKKVNFNRFTVFIKDTQDTLKSEK